MLMAGQKESMSVLFEGVIKDNGPNYVGHGTSYVNRRGFKYAEKFSRPEAANIMRLFANQLSNTPLLKRNVLPYTFNIGQTARHIIDKRYFEKFYWLYPLINIQSEILLNKQRGTAS
jgi:hypothetical protein